MDRSFLSDKQLIKASRDFVCIRTATYEDEEEAKFLTQTFVTRSGGTLRNFGYCILSPDGQQKLRRSDRGPNFAYANSDAMAADLREVASQYQGKTTGGESNPAIPQMKSVRLGINVASCDGLPSVVVVGKNPQETDQFKEKLGGVIWDEDLAGMFIFASTSNPDDLQIVSGASSKTGILVIKPDTFGIKGQLITAIDPSVPDDELKTSLADAADMFQRNSKTHGTHVRNGRRTDTIWKTEVPVPDRVRSRSDERGGSGRSGRGDGREGERGGPPGRGSGRSRRGGDRGSERGSGRSGRGGEGGRTEGAETGGGEELAERISALKKRLEEAKKAGDKATAERLQRQVDRVIRTLGGSKEGEDKA